MKTGAGQWKGKKEVKVNADENGKQERDKARHAKPHADDTVRSTRNAAALVAGVLVVVHASRARLMDSLMTLSSMPFGLCGLF